MRMSQAFATAYAPELKINGGLAGAAPADFGPVAAGFTEQCTFESIAKYPFLQSSTLMRTAAR